jgi:hypothetical protein
LRTSQHNRPAAERTAGRRLPANPRIKGVPVKGTSLARLRVTALSMMLLLVAQFVVGIVANLYVTIPATIPGTKAGKPDIGWALAHSPVDLRIHVVLAFLLVAAALVMAGLGVATRRAAWIITTLTGAVMILVATSGGLGFLSGASSASSLQMALGFMGAFLAYAAGFYVTKTSDRPAARLRSASQVSSARAPRP